MNSFDGPTDTPPARRWTLGEFAFQENTPFMSQLAHFLPFIDDSAFVNSQDDLDTVSLFNLKQQFVSKRILSRSDSCIVEVSSSTVALNSYQDIQGSKPTCSSFSKSSGFFSATIDLSDALPFKSPTNSFTEENAVKLNSSTPKSEEISSSCSRDTSSWSSEEDENNDGSSAKKSQSSDEARDVVYVAIRQPSLEVFSAADSQSPNSSLNEKTSDCVIRQNSMKEVDTCYKSPEKRREPETNGKDHSVAKLSQAELQLAPHQDSYGSGNDSGHSDKVSGSMSGSTCTDESCDASKLSADREVYFDKISGSTTGSPSSKKSTDHNSSSQSSVSVKSLSELVNYGSRLLRRVSNKLVGDKPKMEGTISAVKPDKSVHIGHYSTSESKSSSERNESSKWDVRESSVVQWLQRSTFSVGNNNSYRSDHSEIPDDRNMTKIFDFPRRRKRKKQTLFRRVWDDLFDRLSTPTEPPQMTIVKTPRYSITMVDPAIKLAIAIEEPKNPRPLAARDKTSEASRKSKQKKDVVTRKRSPTDGSLTSVSSQSSTESTKQRPQALRSLSSSGVPSLKFGARTSSTPKLFEGGLPNKPPVFERRYSDSAIMATSSNGSGVDEATKRNYNTVMQQFTTQFIQNKIALAVCDRNDANKFNETSVQTDESSMDQPEILSANMIKWRKRSPLKRTISEVDNSPPFHPRLGTESFSFPLDPRFHIPPTSSMSSDTKGRRMIKLPNLKVSPIRFVGGSRKLSPGLTADKHRLDLVKSLPAGLSCTNSDSDTDILNQQLRPGLVCEQSIVPAIAQGPELPKLVKGWRTVLHKAPSDDAADVLSNLLGRQLDKSTTQSPAGSQSIRNQSIAIATDLPVDTTVRNDTASSGKSDRESCTGTQTDPPPAPANPFWNPFMGMGGGAQQMMPAGGHFMLVPQMPFGYPSYPPFMPNMQPPGGKRFCGPQPVTPPQRHQRRRHHYAARRYSSSSSSCSSSSPSSSSSGSDSSFDGDCEAVVNDVVKRLEKSGFNNCCICQLNQAELVFCPCEHMAVCFACGQRKCNSNVCPVCGVKVKHAHRVLSR